MSEATDISDEIASIKTISTIKAVIALFGRKEMAEMLGVDPRAISEAKARRILPSSWFDRVNREAQARDVVVSPHLFNFKPPAPPCPSLTGGAEDAGESAAPGVLPRIANANECAQ